VLNDNAYFTAICIYVGSAAVLIMYIGWWLGRHWRAGWVTLVVLLLAALLLTPAYPKAGVHTMAPALIVAAFQFMTAGVEGARHALRPLIFMSGAAVIIALLLSISVFRRRRVHKARPAKQKPRPRPTPTPRSRAKRA
jgi:Na+/melibiose symporter-like transporter